MFRDVHNCDILIGWAPIILFVIDSKFKAQNLLDDFLSEESAPFPYSASKDQGIDFSIQFHKVTPHVAAYPIDEDVKC